MNLEGQKQLLRYIETDIKSLSNNELDDYLWLIEELLQECRTQIAARRPPWELDDPNT